MKLISSQPLMALRYPLALDKQAGRIVIERDYASHVKQLIFQVLLTDRGERICRPDFGCGVRRMVWAPNNDAAASLAQVTILQALERWLGDVIDIAEVTVAAREEVLEIGVAYFVKARGERHYLNIEVTL
jgi:hypothetical protein